MKAFISALRDDLLLPLIRRPPLLQVAALCLREGKGRPEVLLVTSRGTGRWILPKGWPIKGTEGHGAALREAWEEAGVLRARAAPEPVGRYRAVKRQDAGYSMPCDVLVYRVSVEAMTDDFPEKGERRRIWVSPKKAAQMVVEADLKRLLASL
ncbi:NUDIX hydrolase [Acuticoccus mangrovi]|uniref:NUDIX hydrolase n=1 Tax=Acuticoccus mangrovi TaxID=2796142 RepID=A0A934MBV2_9HYPH|nr:NUDIX hydrolase [Acuticoccus mangrovi]MBJ3774552.1 NUDIX hydrolase [Acuticoccus mangrovi]